MRVFSAIGIANLLACTPHAGTAPPASPKAQTGDTCKPEPTLAPGSGGCEASLICYPAPGGYCTRSCGFEDRTCGPEATCVETTKDGDLCLRKCATDADCRHAQGYVCDPVHKVCAFPKFVLTPPAPVCTAARPPKKSFGPAHQLTDESSPGWYQFEPSAGVLPDGRLAVAYSCQVPSLAPSNPVAAALIGTDGKVLTNGGVPTVRAHAYDEWMAVDRTGRAYLVWLAFNGMVPEQEMQISLSTTDVGSTWSAPLPVHDLKDCPAPGCMDKPMVVVGPSKSDLSHDTVYVFYASDPSGGLMARASSDRAKTFGPSTMIPIGAYADAAVDAAGAVHVVGGASDDDAFVPFGGPRTGVDYVRSDDRGKTFSKPARVSATDESMPFFFGNPQVLADAARGFVYVVYPNGGPDLAWDLTLATSRDGGRNWSRRKVNDDTHCANHMTPTAALDPATGTVHVIWLENRDDQGGVGYASCAPGGATCSANERVNDAPFASYSLVRHSPRWLGEYQALVVDAKHHVLHAVWAQTVEAKTGPTSRIFYASRRLEP